MSDNTKIEWTDATWNPITGCSVVSPGCTNCYAMRLAGTRLAHHPSRSGLTDDSKAGPVWNGKVRFNAEWLTQPLSWRRPRKIFVCAHGDLFHENVPDEWIDKIFAVMALAPQHTFQVLTKRSARMREYLTGPVRSVPTGMVDPRGTRLHSIYSILSGIGSAALQQKPEYVAERMDALWYPSRPGGGWPLPNVWLGVTCEDQARADERIPDLLATPAAARFVSAEPMLGPIDFSSIPASKKKPSGFYDVVRRPAALFGFQGNLVSECDGIDWIIVGGESGRGARPMHPDWVRSIRDQCKAAGVAFHFKQWGEWREPRETEVFDTSRGRAGKPPAFIIDHEGHVHCFFPSNRMGCVPVVQVGKARAGRLLDGVEHNGMPEPRT